MLAGTAGVCDPAFEALHVGVLLALFSASREVSVECARDLLGLLVGERWRLVNAGTVCRTADLERACCDIDGDGSLLLLPASLAGSIDSNLMRQEPLLLTLTLRGRLECDLPLPLWQNLETDSAAGCSEFNCLFWGDRCVLVLEALRMGHMRAVRLAVFGASLLLPGEDFSRLGLREGDAVGRHLAGDADRLLLIDLAGFFFPALRLRLREGDALGCHLAGDLDRFPLVNLCEQFTPVLPRELDDLGCHLADDLDRLLLVESLESLGPVLLELTQYSLCTGTGGAGRGICVASW